VCSSDLGYLIAEALQGKPNTHFLSIMDCCHSGTNTRTGKARMASPTNQKVMLEDLVGHERFIKQTVDGKEKYFAPRGNHIHLAACMDKQVAMEVNVDGQSRGAFTHTLIETLMQSKKVPSYRELMERVRIKIHRLPTSQSPQPHAIGEANLSSRFLGNTTVTNMVYQVSHDQKKGWIVNMGSLHGFRPGENTIEVRVNKFFEKSITVPIAKVHSHYAEVSGMEKYDTDKIFEARIKYMETPKLKIGFAKNCSPQLIDQFRQALQKRRKSPIEWTDHHQDAQYLIHQMGNQFSLCTPNEIPSSKTWLKDTSPDSMILKAETIAEWWNVLTHQNPTTSIRPEEFEIQLYQIQAGDDKDPDDDYPIHPVDNINSPTFHLQKKNNEWKRPAFRLKIKNTGHRTLYVSVLYLTFNFEITNQFLPMEKIEAGKEEWVKDGQYLTIPLHIDDAFQDYDLDEIVEYLKIFIIADSEGITSRRDTDYFNQIGILPNLKHQQYRPAGRRRKEIPDWATKEIRIRIVKSNE